MAFLDAFDALFLMADVDRDGRVSGAEAINFFRAAPDLSQPTLAKIWEFACKGQAGFLTRQEFYNALKLATVAQTGRQLTAELVQAALIGPAAAQIPPPRMNATDDLVEPAQATPGDQRYSCISQVRSCGVVMRQNQAAVDSNVTVKVAGATCTLTSFPTDLISDVSYLQSAESCQALQSSIAKPGQLSPSAFNASSPNSNVESRAVSPRNHQPNGADEISSSGYDGGQHLAAAAPTLKASSWPKMTLSDVQRFVQVFRQVDTDHDGKITGEQARQLFLSWQLPREVLRHVWNLSDDDGDSMLSVREFCTAVYLLERFTEGWPMPATLPRGIHLDEPLTVVKKLGDLPLTDFVGKCSASECAALSTPREVAGLERANNSQALDENAHSMKQNRKPEEQTSTEPENVVPPKIAELTEHGLTQKEKAEYFRSKLQEIVHFKSQCEDKLAKMTETVTVIKHEVNTLEQQHHEKLVSAKDMETEIAARGSTLRHIQEKKEELSRALLKLDTDLSKAPEPNLQARFDHLVVDLHKLERMLRVKAKSQGVQMIKRGLTTKVVFGWQPNIQAKAAEWKKDWGTTFQDEGFVEVEESHINPASEASQLVAMSSEDQECAPAAAAYANVEPGHCATLDCLLGHLNVPPAHKDQPGSVKESPAASSVPVTVAPTTQSMQLPASEDKLMNGEGLVNFNQPPSGTLARDAPVIHPAIETLTAASEAKPSTRAESISSEAEKSSITADAMRGNETIQTMGQTDDKEGSSTRASWDLQNRIQSQAAENRRELPSRGSFVPEDYFDLSPRDVGMPAPSTGGLFLAYTIKPESSASSPIFTSGSTNPPFETLIQTHPVPAGIPVFDESGNNILGK